MEGGIVSGKYIFPSSVKPSHAWLRTGDMGRVRDPESRGVNDIEVNKVATLKKLFTGRHNTGLEMGPQSSIFFFSIKPNPRIYASGSSRRLFARWVGERG